MGVISRKILPACVNMCVCCPALRSRSRRPVKRYKKLLAEIFPKSPDGSPNEKTIVKLCEYASKNPLRIPKIAKFLEEMCYKALRHEHINSVNIVTDTYKKLLCMCKEQMPYFAFSLLTVAAELLDNNKQDALKIIGCQTLERFIYSQSDGTYAHNIENFVQKVCSLAVERGEEHQNFCLRASSLQCISAMLWFMAEFSHIFVDLDEIVRVTLENYNPNAADENLDNCGEYYHNWGNEVLRSEGRAGGGVGSDTSSCSAIIRPRPEKKVPSLLTREEAEMPKVWAQICLQRMVELGKERTTMRRVLDLMFCFFDSGRHWAPQQGMAVIVLSDLSYFMEKAGNQQLVLLSMIGHLDHKNISHNPALKSFIIQVAAILARQIRAGTVLAEIGFVSDLCRHLRKSLHQATVGAIGEDESNLNISLQNSIKHCLLEIAKGIDDARSLYEMMAYTLEKLPSGIAGRATIGSLMILANVISSSVSPRSELVFPEFLLVQILKVMLYGDMEARVGAHQIFSILLYPNFSSSHQDMGLSYQPSDLHSTTASASSASSSTSASSSLTTLLEKLWREKNKTNVEKPGDNNIHDGLKEKAGGEEDWKPGPFHKSSPTFNKFNAIIDLKAGSANIFEGDPLVMKLSEDQIAYLLSAFWIQANLPDNLPSNIEALANSFILTLISARIKNPNSTITILCIQLALSLRKISLDANYGILPPACQRSIFLLSTGMLMFAAKLYQIPHLNHLLKSSISWDVDPYLGISDDLRIFVKPNANSIDFGSVSDNMLAMSLLSEFRNVISESDSVIMDILAKNLSVTSELDKEDIAKQLQESFIPDEAFLFVTQSMLDFNHNQAGSLSKESSSLDGVEDDATSEESVVSQSWSIPKVAPSRSIERIMNVGELMESAQELADQLAERFDSTSPLPFNTMVSQCEAHAEALTKFRSWLAAPTMIEMMGGDDGRFEREQKWQAMRLPPPASPFDNFLEAAGSRVQKAEDDCGQSSNLPEASASNDGEKCKETEVLRKRENLD